MNTKAQSDKARFLTYLDKRGLTDKAKRVKDMLDFIAGMGPKVDPLLESINAKLITDPATIVSKDIAKPTPEFSRIIKESIELWNELDWPTKDDIYVRTAGWDSSYYYPRATFPLNQDLEKIVTQILKFVEEVKPEQLVMHPRFSDERARTEQIGVRAKEIPEGVYIQIGQGGEAYITRLEEMHKHYEFTSNTIPADLPEEYLPIAKAMSVIVPICNSCVPAYSPKVTATNLPVYEFKVVQYNHKYLINLFDYELM